jgi:diadenosine tetraphosphate (Ap4A) HIT family hydrolase
MSCWICELEAPGGAVALTPLSIVDVCIGPLNLGTLIVRPRRHVERVGELSDDEAQQLGLLVQRAAAVIDELVQPSQVYVCLWSHAERQPGHIHFVVQPVTDELMSRYDAHAGKLQVAMFEAREYPTDEELVAFAEAARNAW